VIQIIGHWRTKNPAYYAVSTSVRATVAGAYFGLMGLLGMGMTYIHDIHADMFINK